MEINRGLFQIAVSEQNLDSPQVRAVFKQVSGEAVTPMPQVDVGTAVNGLFRVG